MGWDDVEKSRRVFNIIHIYSFKFTPSTFTRRLALDQDRDVCESASQIISCQISGARPYSRSDRGLPPSHESVSDSLARPALWSHGRTCEEETQEHNVM